MVLTKTDFIHYLNCPKSMWLEKHDPENFPRGEFSAFQQKLVQEGREVEVFFRQLLDGRAFGRVDYEVEFQLDDLCARADGLAVDAAGQTTLYEVKSSTRVKTDAKHNHLKDACFQKICAELAGQPIHRVVLVHLNSEYVRRGEIDPAGLLVLEDITDRMTAIEAVTRDEMDAAVALLQDEIDRVGCNCLRKSRANHCDAFSYFNPDMPNPSIYSLPRLQPAQLIELVDQGQFDPRAVPEGFQLGKQQGVVLAAFQTREPQIDHGVIKAFFKDLVFPLYFLDYETYASAVPLLDGISPHKAFPVQYSLHILDAGGQLTHHEYLEQEARLPHILVAKLRESIAGEGSVIAWHASFERTQNHMMAQAFPQHEDFLLDLNKRMIDLEEPFKTGYVDARFGGSTSIKKVLPVVCPDMNYDDLAVQDGAAAMNAWSNMLAAPPDDLAAITRNLLRYCERDTEAMVGIYRFLNERWREG
ncbi:DUF2779 domain-containing protein [Roseovarius mucosus]|uniref:DUF2779 domain-containing protein n=1 Tax=Roseovarius mucosus TaxID=215743 RepID=UPI001C5F6FF2|nr:DUF2779 domain-containing protein [Roseovarius mucosus]MBW4976296.1 DUF2779 domain-containing protein [Roseovarius mucosus]